MQWEPWSKGRLRVLLAVLAVCKAFSLVGVLTPVMDWVTESDFIWTLIVSTNPLPSSV